MKTIYSKQIVSHQGIIEGYLEIEDGIIQSINKGKPQGDYINFENETIYPGFIDLHIHGWGRGSFSLESSGDAIIKMGEDQAKEGVTGFLPTTLTDSLENTYKYIEAANEVYGQTIHGAQMLGLHMEGPFINPKHKGMQEAAHCIKPDLNIMKNFYNMQKNKDMIKLITMAPELDPSMSVIKFCKAHQIQVSAGHTAIGLEALSIMKDYGVGGMTHMFSGMQGFHHRDLGSVGAALYLDDIMCEFAKQTGLTIKHEAFNLAYRIKGPDRIFMTTDCIGFAQVKTPRYHYIRQVEFIPDGDNIILKHDNGQREVISKDDYEAVRDLEMGYIDSIKNMLIHTPMGKKEIAKICSSNPAKYIHLDDRKGKIMVGYDADLTILTDKMDVRATYVKGNCVYESL